jgi:hypothetical protein
MWEILLILIIIVIALGWYYLRPEKPKSCPCAANKNMGQL